MEECTDGLSEKTFRESLCFQPLLDFVKKFLSLSFDLA